MPEVFYQTNNLLPRLIRQTTKTILIIQPIYANPYQIDKYINIYAVPTKQIYTMQETQFDTDSRLLELFNIVFFQSFLRWL